MGLDAAKLQEAFRRAAELQRLAREQVELNAKLRGTAAPVGEEEPPMRMSRAERRANATAARAAARRDTRKEARVAKWGADPVPVYSKNVHYT